ncbi:tyrosine-type recombinase/integrase [Aestuariicella sp. G3-2]|uniref:phage integrase n=1 Tax=Pseudomaricurvus albidus TaxID=2842452 RepID=UPI001C0DA754|nr:tyrosine-type recombinase/integrase [Aestuariicella albida]MBU3068777.1 tyrosine-type recombinase/integrase [Aestuariicella albida]
MAVTKQPDGRWLVSCRPQGTKGPHVRRVCKTRTEGVALERRLMNQKSASMDNALLSECVTTWFNYWGVNLKDGQSRKNKLDLMVAHIGDYRLSKLKPIHYLEFRKQRLTNGISPNTCNHDLVYLKTVFNKLIKNNLLTRNPFDGISPLKLDDYELAYLTNYQIKRLLVACRHSQNESLLPVVLLALSTGARWSEAERLTMSQVGYQNVTYSKTKNGKSRTVPISESLFKLLRSRIVIEDGRIFANCLAAFRSAVKRAKITLPRGQMSHVLRHTFASHLIMNGCDLVTLQKTLGHSDIKVTMRYAHLSPDHLKEVVSLNPIARIF